MQGLRVSERLRRLLAKIDDERFREQLKQLIDDAERSEQPGASPTSEIVEP